MSYLTRQEAADRLAVSLRTLDGLISRGDLPAYRIGTKLIRIKEEELESFMKARQVAPDPPKKKTGQLTRVCRYVPGMKVV